MHNSRKLTDREKDKTKIAGKEMKNYNTINPNNKKKLSCIVSLLKNSVGNEVSLFDQSPAPHRASDATKKPQSSSVKEKDSTMLDSNVLTSVCRPEAIN